MNSLRGDETDTYQTISSLNLLNNFLVSHGLIFSNRNNLLTYKKTVVFDPSKSDTYRALQEGAHEGMQEVNTPIQQRTFAPNRLVPGKKPNANHPAPQPEYAPHFNSMGEPNEKIHQSGSFRRLMYHVLSETDY